MKKADVTWVLVVVRNQPYLKGNALHQFGEIVSDLEIFSLTRNNKYSLVKSLEIAESLAETC